MYLAKLPSFLRARVLFYPKHLVIYASALSLATSPLENNLDPNILFDGDEVVVDTDVADGKVILD